MALVKPRQRFVVELVIVMWGSVPVSATFPASSRARTVNVVGALAKMA